MDKGDAEGSLGFGYMRSSDDNRDSLNGYRGGIGFSAYFAAAEWPLVS